MVKITIRDVAGTGGRVTVDRAGAATAIQGWYPEAPTEVTEALAQLQSTLDRGEYTGGLEAFLGIAISD